MVVIYPDKTVIIFLNEAANLLELKNQWGVRFSYPEIFKRLGKITREAVNWPIYPRANGEPQAKEKKGRHTNRSRPVLPERKLKGFELIMELIRDNEKAVTAKTKALREKARAERDGWSLRGGALVRHGRLWVPNETRRT